MHLDEVRTVLTEIAAAGCSVWVAGGWGVDALVGRPTREHRDLDVLADAKDEERILDVLRRLGYVVETDWRLVRVEVHANGRGWVDVHPVVFDPDGHGRQAGLDGASFEYPPHARTLGSLGDLLVPCLTAQHQLQLHTGYEPRDVDCHDIALLEELVRHGN